MQNVLARLNDAPRPGNVTTALQMNTPPLADTARYDRLHACAAQAAEHHAEGADLAERRAIGALEASRWLLEAESTDRVMRSVRHQLNMARFRLRPRRFGPCRARDRGLPHDAAHASTHRDMHVTNPGS